MSRQLRLLATVSIAIVALLAACQSSLPPPSSSSVTPAPQATSSTDAQLLAPAASTSTPKGSGTRVVPDLSSDDSQEAIGQLHDCPGAGEVVLWHSWPEREANALKQALDDLIRFCPQLQVEALSIPFDELRSRFEEQSVLGNGPDLILAPADWIGFLVESGLIQELTAVVDSELSQRYLPTALEAVRYRDQLYALPLSVATTALYFNKDLVEAAPTTLDELLAMAATRGGVALSQSFYHAFWGIPAHGGALFDEAGGCALDDGGFAAWLQWLVDHQDDPGLFLSDDYSELYNLFSAGNAAFFVDASWSLAGLQAALGAERVGVAPLPAGPAGPAGPLLSVEGLMINSAADQGQTELALAVAEYLTRTEAQEHLMRGTAHGPASDMGPSSRAEVDALPSFTDDPASAAVRDAFLAQARTAYPLPNSGQMDAVWTPGNDAYTRVLQNLATPEQAAVEACEIIDASMSDR